MAPDQLALPNGVVTRADVGRLVREAEAVDSAMNQAAIRQPGTTFALPKISQLLQEVATLNKLNLLQPADRQQLLKYLQNVRAQAPVLHMSFNSDPSPVFQQGLITWIRQQIHPNVLLQIGLHPSIGAGCVLRTTNKFFDFSLRQRFKDKRMVLIEKLRGQEAPTAAALALDTAPAGPPVTAVPPAAGGAA